MRVKSRKGLGRFLVFRLLLLVLILLWGVTQTFIGLDVPSSKRVHYSMMNNYGLEAVRMNQKTVHVGNLAAMFGSHSASGYTSSGYAYGPLNGSKSVDVYVSSDVHTYTSQLRSIKNVPVISAASLDANSGPDRLQSVSTLATARPQTETIANTTSARHIANIEKLSNQTLIPKTASTTIAQQPIAFGFGVEASSLVGQLEAAKETVEEEIAQSETSAKAHKNIALRIPFAPLELANVKPESKFGIEQKQSLVFEAQLNKIGTGGLAQADSHSQNNLPSTNNDVTSKQPDFEVALAAYPTATATPVNAVQRTASSKQKIATTLTETSTTVVSGLEITLNPNAAVRRETPAEQQAFLWPLPTRGRLTSGYGNRVLAITNNDFHQGIDIAVKTGTPILAVKDGVIEKAGWEGSYGYAVYVRHNDGTESRYAHMSRIIVEKGEWVNQGQWLGLVGSTGLSTGPHLHFELHLGGKVVDPSKHLIFSGERLATR